MTTAEIQRVLRTLRRESRSGPTLREMRQKPKDDGDWPAIIAAMEAKGLKYFKPSPGRTALRLASFSVAEQEREKAMQEDVEALRSVWENRRRIETIRLAQSRRIKALAPTAEQFERLKTA